MADQVEKTPSNAQDENLNEDDDFSFQEGEVGKEVKLTDDGGVIKTILQKGDEYDSPETGDEVTVHYTGRLLDGTKFDSSVDRNEPFQFELGTGKVIQGWDVGVACMTKGEKAKLRCAPDYAYGAAGSPPTIPENATLEFEVELISWKSIKDINGDGGIIKTIVTEAEHRFTHPQALDYVQIKYAVFLEGKDTPVAQCDDVTLPMENRDAFEVPAIPIALKTMGQGEKVSLKVQPHYGYGDAGNPPSVPAGSVLTVELELLAIQTVEDVNNDGNVVMRVLTKGEGYQSPKIGSEVTMQCKVCTEDGKVMFEHGEGNELKFACDMEEVLEGIDMAVQKMKKGGVAEIKINAEYAYGDKDTQVGSVTVPANSNVVANVTLVDFTKSKESWDMSNEEKVDMSEERKNRGNANYKQGKLRQALRFYDKALSTIEYDNGYDEETKKRSAAVKKAVQLNMAAVSLKRKQYRDVVTWAGKVLENSPAEVKALYRRAQGYMGTADYFEAEMDLNKAKSVDPDNKDIGALLQRLKQEQRASAQKESKMYGRMFGGPPKAQKTEGGDAVAGSSKDVQEVADAENKENVGQVGAV